MDGGGTIDFVEFMVLIYKIQHGAVNIEDDELTSGLLEVKTQLRVFEVSILIIIIFFLFLFSFISFRSLTLSKEILH